MKPFDKYLFHASAYSKLTTQPQSKADQYAGNLSATTKAFLKEIFYEVMYNRKKEVTTKQMEKGTIQEEEGITLFCRVRKKLYIKNTVRINNDFITGEPDLSDNEDVMKTEHGKDIKCPWSLFTLPFPDDKLKDDYESQNNCYMYLCGPQAIDWGTVFTLVNAPQHLILDELKKLQYKMNALTDTSPEFVEAARIVERNMIFDIQEFLDNPENKGYNFYNDEWEFDIPMNERVVEFPTERDNLFIEQIPMNVDKARHYLNKLAEGKY